MKKIILALTALAIALVSCSNGADTQFDFAALEALKVSNPSVASGTDGTESPAATPATGTEAPIATPDVVTVTTIGGITIGADGTVSISSSKVVFVGDDVETIEGVEYKVKKYAQLIIDDNPYFYTYCKLYYLNDKLRRFYSFDHGISREMDYKYDEFREHYCGHESQMSSTKIYTYYEDGKLESYIEPAFYSSTALSNGYAKKVYEYYSNGAVKLYKTYVDINGSYYNVNAWASWALYSKQEYEYHSNGKTKQIKLYSNTNTDNLSEGTMYLSQKTTYTESGKTESSISYSPEGWETSKKLYAYYDNGNQKSYENYSNGKPTEKTTYYESGERKTQENYNNGLLIHKYTYYENGKQKSYENYNSNGLLYSKYTYNESGKTESNITYAADGVTEESKTLYTYYDNGNNKTQESYSNGKLTSKQTYLENGNIESYIRYAADGVTEESKTLCFYYDSGNPRKVESYGNGALTQIYTFYDEKGTYYVSVGGYFLSGKPETLISYAADGVTETNKTLYTYYSSGNRKTYEDYSNGIKSSLTIYFDNSLQRTKLNAYFNSTTGKVYTFTYYYDSSYVKYYYYGFTSGDTFYTYADNKTQYDSTDSSVYSTAEDYTQEQAEAKLAELLNE